jgi:serine/threonine-protein kinase
VVPPEPAANTPLLRVGRYEVISHLATGGMAQIYLARQTGLGSFERHVVLKTIVRERATDQRFVTMFLDEAKLAATLNHQNVAQVYEVDHADGAYFMAMEYVHGENARAILETTIRRGWTIPLELALMIVGGAAAGLHHAHERRAKGGQPLNIVHRDVSPANIMVGFDGSVKVLDFGIAKAEERATKTLGGAIKGKYGYMSPEQCKGQPIDRRSDIFALGIVLYELTTLRRAFKGNDDFETMKRIVEGDVMLPSTAVPGYPRELEQIVLTAMANDQAARFQTAQQLIEALDAFAVREKLTGTNTSMGRFMVQLFGTKKEPWVGGGGNEPTAIGGATVEPEDEHEHENDTDLERTIVSEPRASASGVATAVGVAHRVPAPASVPPPLQADAAAWGEDGAFLPARSHRLSSQRPVAMPDASSKFDPGAMTPAPERRTPHPVLIPASQRRPSGVIPVPSPERRPSGVIPVPSPERRPSGVIPVPSPERRTPPPALVPTPERWAPQPVPVPAPAPPLTLNAADELSQLGAKPLVSDPKLGWQTSPVSSLSDEAAQSLGMQLEGEPEPASVRVTSSTWWLALALMIVLGVAAAVVVIATRT